MDEDDLPPAELKGGQAHHIIPQESIVQSDPVVQWMKSHGYFALDGDANLVPLPSSSIDALNTGGSRHIGSHPEYTAYMLRQLEGIAGRL